MADREKIIIFSKNEKEMRSRMVEYFKKANNIKNDDPIRGQLSKTSKRKNARQPFPTSSVLSGIFSVVLPPTQEDGRLDEGKMLALIEKMLEFKDISGVTCLSSTGEFAYLSELERCRVVKLVIRAVRGRCPVMVGTSAISTKQAIAYSKEAADLGASALLITPQTYFAISEKDVVKHYEEIAKEVSLPIRVYNQPSATHFDITPEIMARLAEIDNITSIKEASGDIRRVQEISLLCKKKPIVVFNGLHSTAAGSFYLGARGWDVTMLPAFTRPCLDFYKAAVEENNWIKARTLFDKLLPLFTFFNYHGVNRSLRAIAEIVGDPLGPSRSPLSPLSKQEKEVLKGIFLKLQVR